MEREDRKRDKDHPEGPSHGSEPIAKKTQESGSAEATGSAAAHLLLDEAMQDGDTVPTVGVWSGALDLVGSYTTARAHCHHRKPKE